MIPHDQPVRILSFVWIDHTHEGVIDERSPLEGEVFWGIPGGYRDCPYPFIEIRKHGLVTTTINCADVSEIEFGEERAT